MTEPKPRRQRRTKASIVNSIEQAAECEIAENGFISSLVTGIIKKAKIEPQVFYNRYTDLNAFYDSFVKKYDYWLADIIKGIEQPRESLEGMKVLLHDVAEALHKDPVMLELIRWEVCEKNLTTIRTSALRELNMQPVTQSYVRAFRNTDHDILAMFAVLIGGIYYQAMHCKLSPFYGIDFDTEEGREQVCEAVDHLVDLIYKEKREKDREVEIAKRLKEQGISSEIISYAINGRY